jgi:hypothetical protein
VLKLTHTHTHTHTHTPFSDVIKFSGLFCLISQDCFEFCENLSQEQLKNLTETMFVPTSNQNLLKKVTIDHKRVPSQKSLMRVGRSIYRGREWSYIYSRGYQLRFGFSDSLRIQGAYIIIFFFKWNFIFSLITRPILKVDKKKKRRKNTKGIDT